MFDRAMLVEMVEAGVIGADITGELLSVSLDGDLAAVGE